MGMCNQRRIKGFSLIEIMIVITILSLVGVQVMRSDARKAAGVAAKAAGAQTALVASAVHNYVGIRLTALQTDTDANCVNVGIPNVCQLDITALTGSGLLPTTWSNSTLWNSPYIVRIRRVPPPTPAQATACTAYAGRDRIARGCVNNTFTDYTVQALIITQNAWADGGRVYVDRLGSAAFSAGPQGGVSNGGTLTGVQGGWSITNEFGTGLINTGQLAYLESGASNFWAQFVRLDGGARLSNNMDMGGHSILNANDLTLLGPTSNRRMKRVSSLAPEWVFKGVYQVADNTFVPQPVCEDDGVAKIKLLFQYMINDRPLFYNGSTIPVMPSTSPATLPSANAQLAANAARYGWSIWADPSGAGWVTHFRLSYSQIDNTTTTFTPGQGLAELYCHYPDKQP